MNDFRKSFSNLNLTNLTRSGNTSTALKMTGFNNPPQLNETLAEEGGALKSLSIEEQKMAKQHLIEHAATQLLERNKYNRIYMAIVWILATSVFLAFLSDITRQYETSAAVPSSTINVISQPRLILPEVIICNWNEDGSMEDPTPTHNCSECELTLVSCTNLNNEQDCMSFWNHTPIQTFAGLFDCYTFNSDRSNPILSASTGYGGGYSTVWRMNLLQRTDPPQSRAGVQVSYLNLFDDNIDIQQTIWDEIRFVQLNVDVFHALTLYETVHKEKNIGNDFTRNSTRYDSTSQGVSLLAISNQTHGYLGVSFAFQTLNKQVTSFYTAYTVSNYFADFSSMLGTLMGLDLIKSAASLPKFVIAWRYKHFGVVQRHFNGG